MPSCSGKAHAFQSFAFPEEFCVGLALVVLNKLPDLYTERLLKQFSIQSCTGNAKLDPFTCLRILSHTSDKLVFSFNQAFYFVAWQDCEDGVQSCSGNGESAAVELQLRVTRLPAAVRWSPGSCSKTLYKAMSPVKSLQAWPNVIPLQRTIECHNKRLVIQNCCDLSHTSGESFHALMTQQSGGIGLVGSGVLCIPLGVLLSFHLLRIL